MIPRFSSIFLASFLFFRMIQVFLLKGECFVVLSSLEIEKIESLFRQNQYNGNLQSPAPYQTKQGKVPVLLISPYATNYYKKNNIQPAHRYTGSFSHLLQKATNCHLAVRNCYTENEENLFAYLKESGLLSAPFTSMIFEIQHILYPAHDDIIIAYNRNIISSTVIEEIQQTFQTYGIFHVREQECSTSLPLLQFFIHPKWIQPNQSLISHQFLYNAFAEIILQQKK